MPAPRKAIHLYCGTSRESYSVCQGLSKICLVRYFSDPGQDVQKPAEQQAKILCLGHEEWAISGPRFQKSKKKKKAYMILVYTPK